MLKELPAYAQAKWVRTVNKAGYVTAYKAVFYTCDFPTAEDASSAAWTAASHFKRSNITIDNDGRPEFRTPLECDGGFSITLHRFREGRTNVMRDGIAALEKLLRGRDVTVMEKRWARKGLAPCLTNSSTLHDNIPTPQPHEIYTPMDPDAARRLIMAQGWTGVDTAPGQIRQNLLRAFVYDPEKAFQIAWSLKNNGFITADSYHRISEQVAANDQAIIIVVDADHKGKNEKAFIETLKPTWAERTAAPDNNLSPARR